MNIAINSIHRHQYLSRSAPARRQHVLKSQTTPPKEHTPDPRLVRVVQKHAPNFNPKEHYKPIAYLLMEHYHRTDSQAMPMGMESEPISLGDGLGDGVVIHKITINPQGLETMFQLERQTEAILEGLFGKNIDGINGEVANHFHLLEALNAGGTKIKGSVELKIENLPDVFLKWSYSAMRAALGIIQADREGQIDVTMEEETESWQEPSTPEIITPEERFFEREERFFNSVVNDLLAAVSA